jgi:glycosyltransferase involved in cell wall biosynthesis
MKILFISHSSVVPTYREKLNLLSKKRDIELTLIVPHAWPEGGRRVKSFPQSKAKEGFSILSLPILFEGRIKRHFYHSLFKHIQKVRPDIIHVEEEPYSWVAWQAARSARKLGCGLVFYTAENLLEKFPFPHQGIRKFVLGTADHAFPVDQEAAQLLQKAGFPASRISVLPLGLNPRLFKKKNVSKLKKDLALGAFTAGYVGRLVPEKGLEDLLKAFASLRGKNKTLLLVGNGPSKTPLEKLAVELGIAGQTRWVTAVAQDQIPDYLNCLDVLVLPSRTTSWWKEQFGRVIAEAQACEVPVVGSDSGAIPEVIGKVGFVFPEGDSGILGRYLKKIADSPSLRESLGHKGRRQALKLYTNQKVADKIHRIYQKVFAAKK